MTDIANGGPRLNSVGIIGAGAWGTALAMVAHGAGRSVNIWAREPEVAMAINLEHENISFLPGIPLAPEIKATSELAEIMEVDILIIATPAQHLRAACEKLVSYLDISTPIIICAKGIELASGALMSEIVETILPKHKYAVLSGPTFASEVAMVKPAAATLACLDSKTGDRLAQALRTPNFRIYQTVDVIGAEVGGAVKNVIAIACGIVNGRGLGDSARAAIITRGLSEMARISRAKGGRPETLMGLSGIGDLTLTCNAMQSRNFSLGVAIGGGQKVTDVLAERISVAEGIDTAAAVGALVGKLGVDAPICLAVNAIVNNMADTECTIASLLARPVGTDSPFDENTTN